MNESLIQYYRCPEHYVQFALKKHVPRTSGYFRFGENEICYGRYEGSCPSVSPLNALQDACRDVTVENGIVSLPFNLTEVIENLRYELYTDRKGEHRSPLESSVGRVYYLIRPLLPVAIRKHLQRIQLRDWDQVQFPHWPVDRTVDNVLEQLLLLSLKAQGLDRIPFIWFWPKGAAACAIMTHDVESAVGRDFSSTLMDIDDSFGMKASFQVVPERRYKVTPEYLASITDRGFEVAVQDLNHDGKLYSDRELFLSRASRINAYGKNWGATGFRGAILYRKQTWFEALDFSYDMSVPNVAHLDPQRGGCCTIMPYFVGNLVELPVTTTQDYTLFHILKDYSIDLWKRQIDLIMEKHGLMNFIIHPDYITTTREQVTYKTLLGHLAQMRDEKSVWMPTPGEVNLWWRQRAEMKIVDNGEDVRIEGPGSERACLAYASEKDGRLAFKFERNTVADLTVNSAHF